MSPRAKIAHQTAGRIRLKLETKPDQQTAQTLLSDLQLSPDVKRATLRGSSLIIEHSDDEESRTAIGKILHAAFPDFEKWSDDFDAQIAEITANPWVNKTVPLGFLGLAIYTGMRSGTLLAGESAFALGYVAFDLYWKFQQENVVRKIEQGLSQSQREAVSNAAQ